MSDEPRSSRRLPSTTDASTEARDARRARLAEEGLILDAITGVAPPLDSTRLAVDMKVLIEQMREQIQNIE